MAQGVAEGPLFVVPLSAPALGIVFLSDHIARFLPYSIYTANGGWGVLLLVGWAVGGLVSLVLWITTSAAAIQYAEHRNGDSLDLFELGTARGRVSWCIAVLVEVVLSATVFALCPDCPYGGYIP